MKKVIIFSILLCIILFGVFLFYRYKEEQRIMNIIKNNPEDCLKDAACFKRLKTDFEGMQKYQEQM